MTNETRSLWHRLPKEQRAGTVLDWRAENCREIWGPSPYGMKSGRAAADVVHGVLDRRQRVYQSGGELKNFVLWKADLVTLEFSVWDQIQDDAEWIELIDHELNHCYRIRVADAAREGWVYDAGIGPRWGVPRRFWSRSGSPTAEPARPVPSQPQAPTVPTPRQWGLF